MDSGLPEVLPTELLGWLMLRRCSLSPQQRLNVLSARGSHYELKMLNKFCVEPKMRYEFKNLKLVAKARDVPMFVQTFGLSRMVSGDFWLPGNS